MSPPPSMRLSEFASLLRAYRRARGLTQEELAARAGISVRSLGYLERGDLAHRPRRDTVRLLIQALALADDEAVHLSAAARADPSPTTFSALSSPAARAIPAPLTALIGRERDEAVAVHLLLRQGTHLLTLTGPAGVGKTRLAVQVATTLRDAHAWAVRVVSLMAVREHERVLPAIAQALGIQDAGTRSPHDMLVSAFRNHPVLLALDNFEQVLDAAPALADLLGVCPHLKVLVTSRAPLNVRGEQVLPVQPLALPDALQPPPVEQLKQIASVALFVERARAVAPDFLLDPTQHGAYMAQVATLCRLVDGLPLAIELAAAQIRHLSLDELAARVSGVEALGVLAGGARDLADHQRTMRSTIAWSYALLAPDQQYLLRILSVFAGGATLDAIQAVARVNAEAALAGLSALVDNGLARRTDHAGGSRFDQLVVVRAYAREQLRAAGEEEDARRWHAEFCRSLVLRVDQREAAQAAGVLEQLDIEYENLHSALMWARDTGAIALGLRLAGGLRRFWFAQFHAGQEWLDYFIARTAPPETPEECSVLADAWTGVMVIAYRQDRFERAREAGDIALALRHLQGDNTLIAVAMMNLANPVAALHDYERALALCEDCLAIHRETGNRRGMILPLLNLGGLYYEMGKTCEALAYDEESLALSREVGESDWARALTWNNIGKVYLMLDDPARTLEVTSDPHHIFTQTHDHFGMATCAFTLGRAEWRLGNAAAARSHLDEAERLFRDLGNPAMVARIRYVRASLALNQGDTVAARGDLIQAITDLTGQTRATTYLWWIVERVGTLACRQGHMAQAAHLCAAGIAHRDAEPGPMDPAERDLRARDQAALEATLGPAAFAAATTAGQTFTLDAALALAHHELLAP